MKTDYEYEGHQEEYIEGFGDGEKGRTKCCNYVIIPKIKIFKY